MGSPSHHFSVYMLTCADGSCYIGQTDHLEARVAAHQRGTMHGYTLHRRPVRLVRSQVFEERVAAIEAEQQIKRWSRAKKAALASGDTARLRELAALRKGGPASPTRPARRVEDR
jgi:tRNA/rRNA methyltransferase